MQRLTNEVFKLSSCQIMSTVFSPLLVLKVGSGVITPLSQHSLMLSLCGSFFKRCKIFVKFNDTYSLFHIQVEFGEELEGDENNNGGKKEQAMEFNGPEIDNDELKERDEVRSNYRCSTCFVSHFPRPNTQMCKGSKLGKKKKEATKMPFLLRLRGGATNDQTKNMIDRAIVNGKMHGINLHSGVENLGNGNCAFECVLDSINTRECFPESYDGTPDHFCLI